MSKHTQKYWESRLKTRPGTSGLQVRLHCDGVEHWFNLGTEQKQVAAAKAKEIWLSIQAVGLEQTLAIYKPKAVKPEKTNTTIGELIRAARPILVGRTMTFQTFETYASTARRVVADLSGKGGDIRRLCGAVKPERYNAWLDEVDGIKLDVLTEDAIKEWISNQLDEVATNPAKLASRKRSLNARIASLKSLFSPELAEQLKIRLPDPPPFFNTRFFEKGNTKYVSKIDAKILLVAAINDLRINKPEEYKVFLLALCAGLRRHEIDLLEWAMLDFKRNALCLRETELLSLKTDGSAAEVDLDPEIMDELRSFMPLARSKYVIASDREYKQGTKRLYYRCQPVFGNLIAWLKSKGVNTYKPLHELRKEFGAILANEHGIFAASRGLRHSDIRTTAAHYVDKKKAFSVGLGKLLAGPVVGLVSERTNQAGM